MSYIGRKLRERRLLFQGLNSGLIVPIDHGLTMGPIKGINNFNDIERWINNENVSAIIVHKGMLESLVVNNVIKGNAGVIVQLNGMLAISKTADTKELVTSIEAAIRLGADAVSIQVNFTNNNFAHNLDTIGKVVDEAHKYGLPVLTMLYDKVDCVDSTEKNERMLKLANAAVELGVDAIKIAIPENKSHINSLMLNGLIKVFFAGGDIIDDQEFIDNTELVMKAGATGLCAGRNIFQHSNPNLIINQLAKKIRTHSIECLVDRSINDLSHNYEKSYE
ncbi:class I fructose-bisphosphate aldolase [Colwellia psychrerythraea]|uniref:Deoxyribose-phosphate aldolase/phospho-2-dehydro-3-deoxyheptonate aldolase n=1 Tax=Colwellia psychrerythraea TaxID=28229 RepID=A0A099L3X1_COLPS|nr:type I 3-dehydroquinate dehydratase [Colwellia psychrerythraea]KGJ97561.1 deoxyribose-phosphate aldolase/phospho-2-dehydro-3-deoxyheptonate aldolase [Colwellia psychrerythraea]